MLPLKLEKEYNVRELITETLKVLENFGKP
jgi:hypothetical protein